jgi:hypothetical protein
MPIALVVQDQIPQETDVMETSVRQGQIANVLRDLVSEVNDEQRPAAARATISSIASQYAWALYHDIVESTGRPPVSPEMEQRRGVPSDPGYFDEVAAIKEFLDVLAPLGKPTDIR